MVRGVRSESQLSTSPTNLLLWLAENNGGQVQVPFLRRFAPGDLRLYVGLPFTAPRSIICQIWLLEPRASHPLLAGRLRAVVDADELSTRLYFEGSAATELIDEAQASRARIRAVAAHLASHLLDLIATECEGPASERLSA
jgi:hypothetical protein